MSMKSSEPQVNTAFIPTYRCSGKGHFSSEDDIQHEVDGKSQTQKYTEEYGCNNWKSVRDDSLVAQRTPETL